MIPYQTIMRHAPSLITEIDPSLEYVKKFNGRVHHVRKDGKDHVFRFGTDILARTLERELMASELADEQEETPNIEEVYHQNGEKIALRKTFLPGRQFNPNFDQHLKDHAYDLVKRLHSLGISFLDLKPANMIVNDDKLYLPDLDAVSIKGVIGDYGLGRTYDKRKLVLYFGKI